MKTIILLFSFACLTGCWESDSKYEEPQVNTLPSFNISLMDSISNFNTQNIPTGKEIVLFYFSPDCPFCLAQIKDIILDIHSFRNVDFYFFSNFPYRQVYNFYNRYQLNKYKNITVGQDRKSFFRTYYQTTQVPYMAFYNKKKQLKKLVAGRVDKNAIKNIILE
jgi:hypothetical protein